MTPPKCGWSKSLDDCHEAIQKAYPKVCDMFFRAYPGCSLKVDYTWRGPELQFELFKKGRELVDGKWVVKDKALVVTEKDGSKPSHHQTYPSQAADIYIVENGKILWPPSENNHELEAERVRDLYVKLGTMWNALGIISGATWRYKWLDLPHVQVAYSIV